jgi:hypothetical protein
VTQHKAAYFREQSMGKAKPRYDLHFWNLDFLDYVKLQPLGELRPIYPPQPDANDCISLLGTGEVIILSQKKKVLAILRPDTYQWIELTRFAEHENLIDMAVGQESVYFYEASRGAIIRIGISDAKIVAEQRWILGKQNQHPFARLAVSRPSPEHAALAYLAPTSDGGILAVELTDSPTIKHLPPPEGSSGLDSNVHICVDARNRTLLVTEPAAKRVTEMNYESGASAICWTPTTPTLIGSLGEHYDVKRSVPRSVAIYRTRRLIPQALIKLNSRDVLTSDPTKVRPRTLLIADSGNFCIWKLVQLPFSPLLLDLAGKNQMLAFLGSGNRPELTQSAPRPHQEENLRKYHLPPPRDIGVSYFGEILVRSEPEYAMLLLRPATAKLEGAISREAKSKTLDWSD